MQSASMNTKRQNNQNTMSIRHCFDTNIGHELAALNANKAALGSTKRKFSPQIQTRPAHIAIQDGNANHDAFNKTNQTLWRELVELDLLRNVGQRYFLFDAFVLFFVFQ